MLNVFKQSLIYTMHNFYSFLILKFDLKYHTLRIVTISKISLKKPGLIAFCSKRSRLRNKSVEKRRAIFLI